MTGLRELLVTAHGSMTVPVLIIDPLIELRSAEYWKLWFGAIFSSFSLCTYREFEEY